MKIVYRSILISSLTALSIIASSPVAKAKNHSATSNYADGYSALKLFLEDEQYLTTIRRAKLILTFSGISDRSTELVDNIADTSEQAIDDLEALAAIAPPIMFKEFSDDAIAKSTLDSLRMTTAKELFFESENFEKNLLLSQLNILRLISHLATELEKKESNHKRKKWLNEIAINYEAYYQRVLAGISVSSDT